MARPMHRFRNIRLTTHRQIRKDIWYGNRPRKTAERTRRDARMVASIKANKTADYSPAVKSWVSARLDKAWRQVTKDDIKAIIA